MILSSADFANGLTKISADQNRITDFETFLGEEKENSYIKKILGVDLGQEFIDDLNGSPSIPVQAKFQKIFSYFDFDISGCAETCLGIKTILIYLFYKDYVGQQNIINQSSGNAAISREASTDEGLIKKSIYINNLASEEIALLQYYVMQDTTTYEDFNGSTFYPQTVI